jgi:plastocyanin
MRSTGALLLSLGVVALAGGCGGSSSSTSGAPPGPAATGGASGGSSSSSGSAGGTTSAGATLSAVTPPKYASPAPGSPVRSGVVQIAYRNITIQPDAIRVRVGSTLRWTNFDPVEHTVTSRGGPQTFASGKLSQGASFQIRVQQPGTIHYLCTIHPVTMNGTIEVVG